MKEIDYGYCIDVTKKSLDDRIYEKTGINISLVFYRTLRQNGFQPNAIENIFQQYDLNPTEKVRKIKKNSLLAKNHPEKKYTYRLIEPSPLKYRRVLRKLGINTNDNPVWGEIEKFVGGNKRGW